MQLLNLTKLTEKTKWPVCQ